MFRFYTPPPRSLVKATRRLNPVIDFDLDILTVRRAAVTSTFDEWSSAVLTNTLVDNKGVVRLNVGSPLMLFSVAAGAATTAAWSLRNGAPLETLWIDFFPDPDAVGPSGFVLDKMDVVLGTTSPFNFFPLTIIVAQFDQNWNRVELSRINYEVLAAGPAGDNQLVITSGAPAQRTINFKAGGRYIRIGGGKIRSRTGSGRDGSGNERTNAITIEGQKKVSHLDVNLGFSIGFFADGKTSLGVGTINADATWPIFDRTQFWRVATDRHCGPYSPDTDGPSGVDPNHNPGYRMRSTGAVPGYGAINTSVTLGGKVVGTWGMSRESGTIDGKEDANSGSPIFHRWSQPFHQLYARTFVASGTAVTVLDLGGDPTAEVHFRSETALPIGTNVTFTARGSNNGSSWTSLGTIVDGKVWTTAETRYRYYEITSTLTASSNGLASPELFAVAVTERVRHGVIKYSTDFDSKTTVDPVKGQSEIAELNLPLLKAGRNARDLITRIASNYPLAYIEAWLYVRETMTGIRHFLNLYRLEDRSSDLGQEEFVFVSGMDRLKAVVPRKQYVDQYPSDGTNGSIAAYVYNSTTNELSVQVSGTPFAGKNIVGWQFNAVTGDLKYAGTYFIVGNPGGLPGGYTAANTFTIVLNDDSQEPSIGDKFRLTSGQVQRVEVNYGGQDFSLAFADIIDNQAAIPARFRGARPGLTGRTTLGRLSSDGRPAIEPLQEVALHCDGGIGWIRGRISFFDIYNRKPAAEIWDEYDYSDLKTGVGLSNRMPSVVVKYGYDFNEKAFPFEVAVHDRDALIGLGLPNLFDEVSLPDSLCVWNTEQEAKRLGEKMSFAWSTGVRVWSVQLVIPRPWREIGDWVAISTDQYADRRLKFDDDGLNDLGSPVSGRISASGVIVGKNLLGTEFEVAIPGLQNIQAITDSGTISPDPNALTDRSLSDFKFTDSGDGLTRTFTAVAGSWVTRVFVYETTLVAPPTTDPWPAAGATPTDILIPDPGTRIITYEVTKPNPGFQTFIQFEPRMDDLSNGPVIRAIVDPYDGQEPSSGSIVIKSDGVADANVDGPGWAGSLRYKVSTVSQPTDADVIATGTNVNARTLTLTSIATLTLGATVYLTVIPFFGANSTGYQGTTLRLKATRHDFSTTKTTYASFASLLPTEDTAGQYYKFTSGYITNRNFPTASPLTVSLFGMLPIPDGVTITEFRAEFYEEDRGLGAGDLVVRCVLQRLATDGTITTIATVETNTVGWQSRAASISESSTSRRYRVRLDLDEVMATASLVDGDLRASVFSYTYTQPSAVNTI